MYILGLQFFLFFFENFTPKFCSKSKKNGYVNFLKVFKILLRNCAMIKAYKLKKKTVFVSAIQWFLANIFKCTKNNLPDPPVCYQ